MPTVYLVLREYERQRRGSNILEMKEEIEFIHETKEKMLANLNL